MAANKTAEEIFREMLEGKVVYTHEAIIAYGQECMNQQTSTLQKELDELKESKILGDRRLVELEHERTVLKQKLQESERLIEMMSDWSKKYPRGRIYNKSDKSMDNELIEIENLCKSYTKTTNNE